MNRISFFPGEFYHIYNRGTEKRKIFLNKNDYRRFLLLLYYCNDSKNVILRLENKNFDSDPQKEKIVEICAYCLMPNHFHLLIREKVPGGISRFLQKLSIGYTMYFNKRYERNGVLFQGKFKATHADEDRYLKYLLAYIHLNPVKILDPDWKENGISGRKNAEEYLMHYSESSYLDHLEIQRPEGAIISRDILPEYFASSLDFKNMVIDWLGYKSDPLVQDRILY